MIDAMTVQSMISMFGAIMKSEGVSKRVFDNNLFTGTIDLENKIFDITLKEPTEKQIQVLYE